MGWWLGVMIGLLAPAAAWACPGCKEALFDPAQGQQVVRTAHGYALSIGLLLVTPTLLIGGLTWWIVRQARRQALQRAQSEIDTLGVSR